MALLSETKYKPSIKKLEDISSKTVLSMLQDVRADIGNLESSFANADLTKVLKIVESGSYKINGKISTYIDLSSAKGIIGAYRKYSEGGCQSCVRFGTEVLDAQDAIVGRYCIVSDPDYNINKIPPVREGLTPKVRKHYDNPCNSWKPKFDIKLEVLVRTESPI